MTQAESDQPALGPDRQLLDASKIAWYNDPNDPHPIQPISITSEVQEGEALNFITISQWLIFLSGGHGQCSCPIHASSGTWLAEVIATEKLNEYGSSCHRFILPCDANASAKCKQPTVDELHGGEAIQVDTDTEDKTLAISVSEGGCNNNLSDSDSDEIEIGNKEVCITLSWFWYKLIYI